MLSPVPQFTRSLTALSAILTKAEAHCVAKKIDPAAFTAGRLIPDMLPFTRQVQIACDHAKGASARLGGVENPVFGDDEVTFADLQARIAKVIAFIATVPEAGFADADDRTINLRSGPRDLSFRGADYLSGFALPNFYFHMATAYNILRIGGVEIGKRDFIGG